MPPGGGAAAMEEAARQEGGFLRRVEAAEREFLRSRDKKGSDSLATISAMSQLGKMQALVGSVAAASVNIQDAVEARWGNPDRRETEEGRKPGEIDDTEFVLGPEERADLFEVLAFLSSMQESDSEHGYLEKAVVLRMGLLDEGQQVAAEAVVVAMLKLAEDFGRRGSTRRGLTFLKKALGVVEVALGNSDDIVVYRDRRHLPGLRRTLLYGVEVAEQSLGSTSGKASSEVFDREELLLVERLRRSAFSRFAFGLRSAVDDLAMLSDLTLHRLQERLSLHELPGDDLSVLERLCVAARGKYGKTSLQVGRWLTLLADQYQACGNWKANAETLQRIIKLQELHFGFDCFFLTWSLRRLAVASQELLQADGDVEPHRSLQVEKLWHRCINIEQEELGRDHPRLAQTREEFQRARAARLSVRDPHGVRSVPGIFGS